MQAQEVTDNIDRTMDELSSSGKENATAIESSHSTKTKNVAECGTNKIGSSSTASASNFLRLGAKQAKAARSARSALRAGIDRSSKRQKLSHSGSGVPLSQVVRLKYVKGFTQAVRTPCYIEDL